MTTTAYTDIGANAIARFVVAGDVGEPGRRLDSTASAMATIGRLDAFDALLLLGDQVYPSGDPERLDDIVFRPFAPVFAEGTPLLAIVGNHDVKDDNGDAQMAALGQTGRWWSRTFAGGRVLLVGLDSTQPANATQLAFLESELATSDADWKIVALHHPPYSAGYQGSAEDVRAIFSPIFERNGVQLVLSGHDHDYQRSLLIDGVTYVVSGAGATTRRTGYDDFTAMSFSWHHFVEIDVFDRHLVVRAVNQDLRVADRFALVR
jgi:predicted phosphodiesterase